MNVWLLPSAFHPHKGGVEELTMQLAREFTRRGHGVRVITIRHPPELRERDEVEGIGVQRLAFPAPRASLLPAVAFPFAIARVVSRLAMERPRPDVLHVQCASAQVFPATMAAGLLRTPLVLTTQGETEMDAADIFARSAYMRWTLRFAARRAAATTACSRWTADKVVSLASGFRTTEVIPNGVDPTQWEMTPPAVSPVVAAWGRHVRQKGFDLLLDAWPRIRELVPGAQLLIGGEGSETPALRKHAAEGVTFTGSLDRSGVQQLLNQSRIVVVPSRVEPFGIVALESMAAGRTVVWSCHGGLAEATGGLGWSVDPNDREALAQATAAALRSPLDPALLRSHAEQLSWTRIAERYLDVYRAALSRSADSAVATSVG
jgi:glycogen(starch) synthase